MAYRIPLCRGERASEGLVTTNSVTAIALQGVLATPRCWRCLGPPEAEVKLGWACGPQGLGLRGTASWTAPWGFSTRPGQHPHCHLAPGLISCSPSMGRTVAAHLLLFKSDPVTPQTVACQVLLSMGFSRQEHWSGLLFPSPGVKLVSPTVAGIMTE